MTPDELLLYFGGTVALIICILIGRFMDPAWRCTKMRQLLQRWNRDYRKERLEHPTKGKAEENVWDVT